MVSALLRRGQKRTQNLRVGCGISEEAARGRLLRLAVKPRNPAVALPKFDVMSVDELLCGFNRSIVAGAIELNRPHEMAVVANDINSIVGHLRHPCRRRRMDLCDQKNRRTSVRSRTRNEKTCS